MKKTVTSKVNLLTITQASQLVNGLTTYRIRQLCQSGELPSFKSGNKWLIQEDVLLDYIRTPMNPRNTTTDNTEAEKED
ncbi:MAG: helix-turn-helix domain-containing protein [Eubacteriales bacterium]